LLVPVIQRSHVNLHTNGYGDDLITELLFKRVGGPPTGTMPGKDKINVKLGKIFDRLIDDFFVRARQVISSNQAVERDISKIFARGMHNIDNPGMRTGRKNYRAFVFDIHGKIAFIHNQRIRFPFFSIL